MFWRRKEHKPRKPGLTGTGEFIANLDWWLWDDPASPGLISIDRFGELRELALAPDEHKRLSILLVKDYVVDLNRRKRISSDDEKFVNYAMRKVGNYLVELRENDFKRLDHWLGFNFMRHDDGLVTDPNGTAINRDILRVIAAYVNCLELWGFGYAWMNIQDITTAPALLLYRNGEPRFSLSQSEVEYIQGKPYRFSIATKQAAWHFDSSDHSFEIRLRAVGESVRF